MANKNLTVTLDANAAKFEAGMRRASRATDQLAQQLARGNRQAAQLEHQLRVRQADALQRVGRGMLLFGGAVVAGLGLATKAAISWESAWAGVRKTVDGSPEELAAVEAGLRDLATTLPVTHAEIAGVAEAAGQLGVATDDIVGFTRVMVDLGETTNLTAQEAATSIAQLMNVMQTAPGEVSNLGSALVELGNNGASTERDILEMAQRIAGAGEIIGLSEADVLAFGNALASVGIEAQAGGTAISRVMVNIAGAVAEGGDAVQGFADVAGMSAADFTRAFEEDPARAIQSFVSGLGQIDAAGGDVFATLDNLGLSEVRVRDALLRLAGAGDLLRQSLNDGNRAWQENTALVEEATQRYDTAESKIRIAWNALVDLAIDVGGVVLPVVSTLAEAAGDLARGFGDLPGPVKTVVTIMGGMVGVAALLGGAFLTLAPRLAAARAELQVLSTVSPAAATGLSALGRAAGAATALFIVASAITAIKEATREAAPGIGETTRALLDLADGVENELITNLAASVEEVRRQREKLQEAKSSWVEYKDSFAGTDLDDMVNNTGELADQFEAIDTALAQLVTGGNSDQAREVINSLADALGLSRGEIDQLIAVLPGYRDALAQADAEQELAGDSAGTLAGQLAAQAAAIEEAQKQLEAYLEELRAATDPVFAVMSALEAVETAQSAYNDAVKEHGKKSAEAEVAALDLAEAVAGVEAAVLDGDLSWQDFDATLDRWVAQGVLTEDQADAIRGSVDEARGAAEKYEGEYPAQLKLARDKAAERAAQRELDRIAKARRAKLIANLTGAAGTEAALNRLARTRTATIRIATTGGVGSGGGVFAHTGGLITPGGLKRYHDGGRVDADRMAAHLRPDERVIVAQTGERVLSRQQTRAYDFMVGGASPYMTGGAGIPRFHDGGMVGGSQAGPVRFEHSFTVSAGHGANSGVATLIQYLLRTGQLNIDSAIDKRAGVAMRNANLYGRTG